MRESKRNIDEESFGELVRFDAFSAKGKPIEVRASVSKRYVPGQGHIVDTIYFYGEFSYSNNHRVYDEEPGDSELRRNCESDLGEMVGAGFEANANLARDRGYIVRVNTTPQFEKECKRFSDDGKNYRLGPRFS